MPAGIAHVDVATERSGPATRDGIEDSSFLGGKSVRACERLTVSTDVAATSTYPSGAGYRSLGVRAG